MPKPIEEIIELKPIPFLKEEVKTTNEVEESKVSQFEKIIVVGGGSLQSSNYFVTKSGWKLNNTGMAEIGSLLFTKVITLPQFESTDAYAKQTTGTGAAITPLVGLVRVKAGNAVDNVSYIAQELTGSGNRPTVDDNPVFSCLAAFDDQNFGDWYIVWGMNNPFAPSTDFFGFKWVKADAKLYAVAYDGASETTTFLPSITTSNITSSNMYRAVCDSLQKKLIFYVNGISVEKMSFPANFNPDPNYGFSVAVRNKTVSENPALEISNLIIYHDKT